MTDPVPEYRLHVKLRGVYPRDSAHGYNSMQIQKPILRKADILGCVNLSPSIPAMKIQWSMHCLKKRKVKKYLYEILSKCTYTVRDEDIVKKNKSFFYYYYFHILIQNLHFKIYFSRCYRFKFPIVLSVSKLFCFHVFYLLKKLRTSQHKKTYIAKFEYIGRLNHGEYFF